MSTTDDLPAPGAPEPGPAPEPRQEAPPAGHDEPPAPDGTTPADPGEEAGPGPDGDGRHEEEPGEAADSPPGDDTSRPAQPRARDAEDKYKAEALSVAAFSETFNNAMAFGGNAYTLNVGTAKGAELQLIRLDATEAARQHQLHHPAPQQDRMAETLHDHHLVVLVGQRGSGREGTGTFLLADRCGSDHVAVLHSAEADVLQALVAQARRFLKPGEGVLVGLGARSPGQSTLKALSLLAREIGAYVVLVVKETGTDDDLASPYSVRHQRAELRPVLEAHLRSALDAHRARCADRDRCDRAGLRRFADGVLDDARVSGKLDAARTVDWVTSFARNIAACLHGPEDALDVLLDTPHEDLRSLARRFLKLSEAQDADEPSASEAETHHQAVRISYVLGHDLPLSDVLRMGTRLSAEMLRAEYRESAPARPVFELDLDRLVAPGMGIAAEPGAHLADNPRRARLTDPELMPAVVEVIWHGFGWLRDPLVAWLRAMADDRLERVGARAAVIVGHLLRHDFDGAYRDVVKDWARSPSVRDRRYAATALSVAMAAGDPRLTAQVARQVRDWAGSPRPQLQDSAARAYGTQVGTQDVPGTLRALRDLAGRPALDPYASVAYSTATLFLAKDGAEPVAEALGQWIRSDDGHLPRHAVRTLLVLGPLAAGPELLFRSTLAHQAMGSPAREETLLLLWQRALIDPAHSGQAWHQLRDWLVAADEDAELSLFLEKFALRAWQPRVLSRRAVFHLSIWARQQPDARLVAQLLRALRGR
ncbi:MULTISPECIES: hypothetical protein [Streptomyces]|uniref:hypothetical protein n=1 Tax=Streptomyces TaxID=1883 RepID=UPI000CF2C226|nr:MULTISPECIES: hypothetical protein [Streptomyces]PPS75724.1 hypothetical protein BV882_08880 [Streptomyces sp. 46]